MDHVIIDPSLSQGSWGAAPDAQINIVPARKFFNQWNTVTAVNPPTGRIDSADSARHGKTMKQMLSTGKKVAGTPAVRYDRTTLGRKTG